MTPRDLIWPMKDINMSISTRVQTARLPITTENNFFGLWEIFCQFCDKQKNQNETDVHFYDKQSSNVLLRNRLHVLNLTHSATLQKFGFEAKKSSKTSIFGIPFKKWFHRTGYPNWFFSGNVSTQDLALIFWIVYSGSKNQGS